MPKRNTIEIVIKGEDLASGVISNITNNLSNNLRNIGDSFISAGRTLTTVTAPIAGALTTAVVQAGKFEEAMYNAGSILGASQDQIADLSDEILAMGSKSRAGPQMVADAYYDIVSGVADATTHMAILDAAIATSEAGNAQLTGTTSALIAIMNSYKFAAEDAGYASDVMTAIVQRGVLTMDQLSASFPQVTGIANAMGISLDELGGQFAYLTTQGYSASTSASLLKNMMATLLNPTADLEQVIKDLGYSSGQAMVDALGLAGAYEAIGNFSGFDGIITSQEALQGALALTGEGANEFLTNFSGGLTEAQQAMYELILESVGLTAANEYLESLGIGFEGATAAAREIQNQSLAAFFDQIKSAVSALWIEVGMALVPMLKEVVPVFQDIIGAAIEWVQDNPKLIQSVAKVTAVATGMGLALIGVGTAIGLLTSPLFLITGAMAGLAIAWDQNWLGMKDTVNDVVGYLSTIWDMLTVGNISGIAKKITGDLTNILNGIKDTIFRTLMTDTQERAYDFLLDHAPNLADGYVKSLGLDNPEFIKTKLKEWGKQAAQYAVDTLMNLADVINIGDAIRRSLMTDDQREMYDYLSERYPNIAKSYLAGLGLDKPGLDLIAAKFPEWANAVAGYATDALAKVNEKILEWKQGFVDWIKPQIPLILKELNEMGGRIVAWIVGIVPQLFAQLYKWTDVFLGWVEPILTKLLPKLGALYGGIYEWILGTGVPILLGALAYLTAALLKWVWQIGAFIVDIAPAALEGFANIIAGIVSGLLQGAGRIAGGINEYLVQPLVDAINDISWADIGDFFSGLWETISTGAGDTLASVRQWVQEHIRQPLVDAINDISWADIGDFFSGLWETISTGAGDTLASVRQWVQEHIRQPLVDAINDISWAEVSNFARVLLNNISEEAVDAGNWVDEHIRQPIVDAINNISWTEVRDQASSLGTNILEWGKTIAGYLLNGLMEISDRVGIFGSILIAVINPALGLILLAMKVWQDGTEKTLKNIMKAFDKITDVLGDFAKIAIDALGDVAAAFVAWIKPQIPIVLAALGEMALEIVGWIGQVIPQLIAALYHWTAAFLRWVGPILGYLLPQLGELIGGVFEWILGTGVPMLLGALAYLTYAFVKWAIESLPVVLPALWEMLKAIGQFIVDVAPAALQGFANIIAGIIRGILEGVGRIAGGINEYVIPPIREALSGVTWGDVGDFLSGLWDTISGGAIDALGWVNDHIVTPVVSAISGISWDDIGDFFGNLWASITGGGSSGRGGAVGAVVGAAGAVGQWIMDRIINPIVDTITTTDWGALIGDLLQMLWDGIVAFALWLPPILEWLSENIINPIVDTIKTTNWGELIGNLLEMIWNGLVMLGEFEVEAGTWIWENIGEPIVDKLTTTNWGEVIGNLLEMIWTGLTALGEFELDAVGWIADNIVTPIIDAISGALPSLVQAGSDLLSAIGEGISSVAGTVGQAFKDAVNDLIPDHIGIHIGRIRDPITGTTIYGGGDIGIDLPNPFALGGLFGRGEYMMTGELGPELGISNMSGMIVGNNQLQSAMNVLAGGVENVAALLQSPREMGLSFASMMNTSGGGGTMGDTYYVTVQVDPSLVDDEGKVERNAETFGDALIRRLRTT